jgi:hypothetical protein
MSLPKSSPGAAPEFFFDFYYDEDGDTVKQNKQPFHGPNGRTLKDPLQEGGICKKHLQ